MTGIPCRPAHEGGEGVGDLVVVDCFMGDPFSTKVLRDLETGQWFLFVRSLG